MSDIFEFEYKGLNILDEISTVEVAIDSLHRTVHIYDTNQVVEPEFNFSTRKYQMSNGFFKMAKVLYDKRFFDTTSQTIEQWVNEWIWLFYGSKRSILSYDGVDVIEIPKEVSENNNNHHLYKKYILRLL